MAAELSLGPYFATALCSPGFEFNFRRHGRLWHDDLKNAISDRCSSFRRIYLHGQIKNMEQAVRAQLGGALCLAFLFCPCLLFSYDRQTKRLDTHLEIFRAEVGNFGANRDCTIGFRHFAGRRMQEFEFRPNPVLESPSACAVACCNGTSIRGAADFADLGREFFKFQ